MGAPSTEPESFRYAVFVGDEVWDYAMTPEGARRAVLAAEAAGHDAGSILVCVPA